MSNKHWNGEEEMHKALQELLEYQSHVPTSKIRNIVSVANKHVGDFKMIVYEIEKFIRKSDDNHKIAGLYVIDSLCKQHSKERELFCKRFALRLKDTFAYFAKLGEKDKAIIFRIVEEWHKKEIFPVDVLVSIFNEAAVPTIGIGSADPIDRKIDVEHANSTVGKRKEVKKASKLCPFRDSSCLFGEKCRFNHNDSNSLDQYALRMCRSERSAILDMSIQAMEATEENHTFLEYLAYADATSSTRLRSYGGESNAQLYSIDRAAFQSWM